MSCVPVRSARPDGSQNFGSPSKQVKFFVVLWGLKKYIKSELKAQYENCGAIVYSE